MNLVGPRRVVKTVKDKKEPLAVALNLAWGIFGPGYSLGKRTDFRMLIPGRPKVVTAAIANIELLEVS